MNFECPARCSLVKWPFKRLEAGVVEEYLPKLGIEELLKELNIPVVYSRECVKPYMMRDPDGEFEDGVCPLTMAKELAMKKVLKKLYGDSAVFSTTFRHVSYV